MSFVHNGLRGLFRASLSVARPLGCSTSWTPVISSTIVPSGSCNFHTCTTLGKKTTPNEPQGWPKYNDIVYPPLKEGEPLRPAEITHFRANIKYSPKKLWYIAFMIRGMSIDEALKQLSFVERKGSAVVKEVLLEAQKMAVSDHNVEYQSNLWIADSMALNAHFVKGMRRHARARYGHIQWRYTHYLVRLREGTPPKHYYEPQPNGNEKMVEYLQKLRNRRIISTL